MPKISSHDQNLAFSPIRKLTPFAEAAKKRGIKIYHLNIGQPDIASPQIFLDKVKEFNQKTIAYEKSDGYQPLKDSIRKYYAKIGLAIEDSDLLVTSGGSEALWMIFLILFEPGQECLCFDPTYTNYLTFAELASVKMKGVVTKIEDNFALPPMEKLKQAVTPKTKAIIITNPSNPTGAVYSEKMLGELVDFCVEKDLFIISDETYREFIYGKIKTRSLLSYKKAEQLVVMTDSFSKRYSLCGARLGMLISKNKAVMTCANKIAQARLSSPTVEQYAASFLHDVPETYFKDVNSEYKSRRDVLVKELSQIPGVKASNPDGAFYLIAELPVDNAEDFCKFMLEKFSNKNETVMMAPAEGFYITPGEGKKQVRIAYVLKKEDLRRAVELIALGLVQYQS